MLRKTWKAWPPEVREWVRIDTRRFEELMERLRFEVVCKFAEKSDWRLYLPKEARRKIREEGYAHGDKVTAMQRDAFERGRKSMLPPEELQYHL